MVKPSVFFENNATYHVSVTALSVDVERNNTFTGAVCLLVHSGCESGEEDGCDSGKVSAKR